jgi:hypothetical protein
MVPGFDRPRYDLETTNCVDFIQSFKPPTSEISRDTLGNSTTDSSMDKLAQVLKMTKLIDFDDEIAQAPELPWDCGYAAVKTCNNCGQTGHANKNCRVEDTLSETLLEVAHQIIRPDGSKNEMICGLCNMPRHTGSYCPDIFPEEEPDYCTHCKRSGHIKDTC